MSIVTENLTKTFNGLVAVNGVSLKVTKGTIFGLLGPNGAGKSTFLRMICTVLRPTSGHGSIEGFDIVNDTNEVRKTIGVVQEKLLLYPTLTAIENLEFFGRLYGIRGKPLREKAEALIEEVKLTSVKDRPVGT
ncbi:MAG: ATP-binding cassette domain-containing protein, partial [Nitrososphaerota archaeon]|nr:ATP-binding cassette domain-containing protein [Nitrososphaerota archaeon]